MDDTGAESLPAAVTIADEDGHIGLSASSVALETDMHYALAYSLDPLDRAAVAIQACLAVHNATFFLRAAMLVLGAVIGIDALDAFDGVSHTAASLAVE